MRKIHLLLLLFSSVIGVSQSISVNTTTYTVPQLVTDVLVNSPCSQVRNITWRTGSNFGSTNGIGYFTNTNPSFPLASGVILSTGNVLNAPGPNSSILSDGNTSWTGDTALETTLAASGITMNSRNATVLEFDFTTYTTFFNFQFLFASEEYGTFQCQSPDAFAFLLTDQTTGTTTNLAVVPSTTTPISVQTIRNNLYNSSCSSANPTYFGLFNGGSAAAAAATNFNGQTIALNASSTLVPNRNYHIKLVIADGTDTNYDSAIFLGGSSFQFNNDVLGPDLTIANNTALCSNNGINQNYTITSGLDPTIFNFSWTHNGSPIGGNTPNLTINQPGTYTLTYTIISTGCVVATNDIIIEYNAALSTPDPVNLYKCNSGLPNYTFDLSYNNAIVNPSTLNTVSYHDTLLDAQNNVNPLTSSLNVAVANLPKTIWVRIQNSNGCSTVKSFILDLTPPPTPTNPGTQTECESSLGSGTAAFDLSALSNGILGSLSTQYNISYHNTAADANANTNPINISNPLITGSTTIYVRVENKTDPNCYTVISFNLVVKPKPILDIVPDKYVCIEYILPALTNPGTYYSAPGGPGGTGVVYPVGTHITTNQTIYIYHATGGTPSCYSENSFKVFVIGVNDITPDNINACDQSALPAYTHPGMRYFKLPGGPSVTGNVEYFPGTTIINTLGTTTIYTYFTFTDTTCPNIESHFDITITKSPTLSNTFTNLFDCTQVSTLQTLVTDLGTANYYTYDAVTDTYTILTLPITSTTHVYAFATNGICRSTIKDFMVYIGSLGIQPVKTCAPPYTLTPAPVGEYRDAPNGGGNVIPPGNITVNTRIYTYIAGATCTYNQYFDITFYKPSLPTATNVTKCENYTLPTNPYSPAVSGIRYFTMAGGPATTGNIEKFAGEVITTTTTLYIYKESSEVLTPVCYDEKPWIITIYPKPIIDSRGDQETCTSYTLSALIVGQYFDNPYDPNNPSAQIALPSLTVRVSDINAQDSPSTNEKIIYITAVNPSDPFCYTESSFKIKFWGQFAHKIENQKVCTSYTLPALPANNFYYNASHLAGGGTVIPAGTVYTSASVVSPIYIYTESPDRFGGVCKDESSFTITIIDAPIANTVTTQVPCDTYTGNNSTNFDGIYQFNLTQYESQVLGTQTPTNYSFKYFKTQTDALSSTATALIDENLSTTNFEYTNSTNPETIWVRIYNTANPDMCYGVTPIVLNVNPLPDPQLEKEYFLCINNNGGATSVNLNCRVPAAGHSFSWTQNGTPYGSNSPIITVNQPGTYEVTVKNLASNCENKTSTTVTTYSPQIEIIYSDAFEEPAYITVNVIGSGTGNYEYQLDNNHYQESNIFYNVSPGEHIISVRDKTGICSPAPLKAVIITYPKFFTPNGDGYNDTWNIKSLTSTNPNAPIFIFDRYGKLIKEITPSSSGWDGTYNGQPLPSTDYWFTVEFNEKGSTRIFKAHFSLKR